MDAYQSLGVSPTATDEEVKKAYRRAQRKFHPDFGGREEDAIRINDAYGCIKDANKRALYDSAGRPQYSPSTGRHDAAGRPPGGPSTAPPRPRAGTPFPRQGAPRSPQAPRQERFAPSTGWSWTTFGGSRAGTGAGPSGAAPGAPRGADPLRPFTDPWGKRWASFRQFQVAFLLQYDDGRGGRRTGPVAGYRDPSGKHWATEDDFRRAKARAASGGTQAASDAQQRFARRLRQQAANPPGPFDLVRDDMGYVWASADHYRWAREEESLHTPGGTRGPIPTAAFGFRAPDGVFWASEDLWRAEAARRKEQQRQEWTRWGREQEERLRHDRQHREADELRRPRAAAEHAWGAGAAARAPEERLRDLQSRYVILVGFRTAGWALGAATAWIVGLIALAVSVVVIISRGAPLWMLLPAGLLSVGAAALWWLLLWLGGRGLGRVLSGLTADELRELR